MSEATAEMTLSGSETLKICTFWLSDRLFGVDIMDVREINKEVGFTPIFHAPQEVRGYVNIRGQIHLVLDLRMLLGFDKKEIDESCRVVIFKPTIAEPFGIMVDSIGDIIEVRAEQIESSEATIISEDSLDDGGSKTQITKGICKLENNLLVLLNARKLLPSLKTQGEL